MSLQKGKQHSGSAGAGQIPPQQRQQYPTGYAAPPPAAYQHQQFLLPGRPPQDAARVVTQEDYQTIARMYERWRGEAYGGQGAHPSPVYGTAPGQQGGGGGMRQAMPPNPSSTPPGQQQQPQMSAEMSKGPHNMQQALAGGQHSYQYLPQHRAQQPQYMPRNQINQRMQQNHRPVAPNTQTQLGYSPQMPQMYANVMGQPMSANPPAVFPHILQYPRGSAPYYAGQPAVYPFFLQYPQGQQNAAMIYNTPLIRGALNQQQNVMAAPAAAPAPAPQHQQQPPQQQQQQQMAPAPAPMQPAPQPQMQPGPPSGAAPAPGRRRNAIKIIDPNSGKDVLEEMYESGPSNAATPPRSGDSSARQTPQPQVDVVAEFAAKVAIAAGEANKKEEPPPVVERVPSTSPAALNGPLEEPPKPKAWKEVPQEAEPTPPAPVPAPVPVVVAAPPVATPEPVPEEKEAPVAAWEPKQQRPQKLVAPEVVVPVPEPIEKKLPLPAEPEEGRNQGRQPTRKPSQKESAPKEAPEPQPQASSPAPEEVAPVPEPQPPPQKQQQTPPPKPVVPVESPREASVEPPPPQPQQRQQTPPPPLLPSNPKTAPATSVEQPPALKEETKMVTVEDKLVAAKNEENSRIAADAAPVVGTGSNNPPVIEQQLPDLTSKLVYGDDQWSPHNKAGKKKYERDFLMQLQYDSQSLKRPEDLPKLEVVIQNRPVAARPMANLSSNAANSFLMPTFLNQTGRGSVQSRKSSQQGPKKPTKIFLNLSLNEDVKLNETENAWKPTVLVGKNKTAQDTEVEQEDLFKKVRSILNKLTPQKFDLLVDQIKKMEINSEEKLVGVIELIFEKAVDEPNFSETYAKLCQTLSRTLAQVPKAGDSGRPLPPPPAPGQRSDDYISFKKMLLSRCQEEFQKEKQLTSKFTEELEALQKQMEESDGARRKELEIQLEETERRMRKKYVGVNIFIGELYKIQILTGVIMMQCIGKLLDNGSEESLECLCKLLTTIGQDLETRIEKDKKPLDLDQQIKKMREIVRHRTTSSRIRFMLQDVIELREDNWRRRRGDQAPKTMDAIAKEAEQEQMAASMGPPGPQNRKDDRDRDRDRKRGGRGGGGGGGANDEGWTVSGGGGRFQSSLQRAPLDSNKLKLKHDDGVSLGSSNLFSTWSKGSSSAPNAKPTKPDPAPVPRTNNLFMVLSDSDKTMSSLSSSQGHDNKARKSRDVNLVGKNSSSDGSVMRRHSRSNSREQQAAEVKARQPPSKVAPMMSIDEAEKKAQLLLEEFVSSSNSEELVLSMREEVNPTQYRNVLDKWILLALEWSASKRAKMAKAMVVLHSENLLSQSVLRQSLAEILQAAADIIIDVPKTFLYLAELFVPLIVCDALPLATLYESLLTNCDKGDACKMLVECLHLLQKDVGPVWIQNQWKNANLSWRNLVMTDVQKFLNDSELTYLADGGKEIAAPAKSENMSPTEMHNRLVNRMGQMTFNEVLSYIDVNVGKAIKTPKYIRALMTLICEVSVHSKPGELHKLNEDTLNKFNRLICLYVDNSPELELQALYAIQAFVNRLQHPPTLLRSILTNLLEESVLSKDAIRAWIKSEDVAEQEGRGVALKSINQFITWLEEPDDSADEAP